MTFNEFGLAPGLIEALERMEVLEPTPIQAQSIPVTLGGADVIAIAQTGSGKTLAYALTVLTLLQRDPKARAVILSPNRETAEQVFEVFEALGEEVPVSSCLVSTGATTATLASQLKKNPRLIVASPGRLNEFIRNNKLLLQGLKVLVLDEADRMLDLGFEPQLTFMQSTLRGERQTLMFAASFGPWAQSMSAVFTRGEPVVIRAEGAETAVDSLKQKVFFLTGSQKTHKLIDEIKRIKAPTMIFTDSQESCVALGRLLTNHAFSAEFVHGDMNAGHRSRVLREFREQRFQILVTTDLLARGLDVSHVEHVINYELPYKADDFLHRIGRTARAGRSGSALTFVTPADGRTYRKIRKYLKGAEEFTLASKFSFDDRETRPSKP